MGQSNTKRRTVRIIIIAVLLCLLMIGGVTVGLNYGEWFQDDSKKASGTVAEIKQKMKIDEGAGDYVAPEPQENEGGGIAIPGWGHISIPAGETEVAVDFPNPEANTDKYYLSFELRMKDSGEILYSSELVPPGKTIQKITLTRALDEGSYNAVVHVQPYKMDEDQTPTNNADMETELVVYNN